MPELDAWLFGRRAGVLSQVEGRLSFTYDPHWVAEGGPPLSQVLPVRADSYGHEEARSFFANLLPEGELRREVARRHGISARNDFALLGALGGDTAGAISLLEPGTEPDTGSERVRWLNGLALERTLEELPRRPLMTDPGGEVRLSLAGAQDKLPVVVQDGRIGLPLGTTPSTHIIKAPIRHYDDTVANEAYCLALARSLGLPAVSAEAHEAAGHPFLLVERYDRTAGPDGIQRLHQEDFCQALGIPPDLKYQSEGGPGLGDCFALVRSAVRPAAPVVLNLVDAVTFNFIAGNHDAHGKNFSLLYLPGGETRLAPLYDLVSTVVYKGLTRKMAMHIGGEYRPRYVRNRHILRFAEEAGLGAAAVRRRMLRLARTALDLARETRNELGAGAPPVVDRIVGVVEDRVAALERELI